MSIETIPAVRYVLCDGFGCKERVDVSPSKDNPLGRHPHEWAVVPVAEQIYHFCPGCWPRVKVALEAVLQDVHL